MIFHRRKILAINGFQWKDIHKITEYLEAFLRNLLLNEEKVDIEDAKVDIQDEKVDIQDKKVDIESVLSEKGSDY